ncbi:hypothetical protein AJ88_08415 [Mesorhizobium amorphae CCBAU 01583]|nr:hypothetical protein AJ88_08415 [Mesorhizobium amorphae CCBAU 01583]
MTRTPAFPTASPPQPEKRPVFDTHHGFTRTDDYGWLRADNWQAMFRDPSLLDGDIRAHLEAENAYQATLTADMAPLRKRLFAEMKGRIKEDDSTVPMKDGAYATARPSSSAASSRAISARRAMAATSRSCSMATPKPRARPISGSAASTIRPTTGSCYGRTTTRALNSSRFAYAISPVARN